MDNGTCLAHRVGLLSISAQWLWYGFDAEPLGVAIVASTRWKFARGIPVCDMIMTFPLADCFRDRVIKDLYDFPSYYLFRFFKELVPA